MKSTDDQQTYRPDKHPSLLDEQDLIDQCKLEQTRRGGPGGQHRNKVSTAIVLVHQPSNVTAEASERRSQADNRRVAIRRLREELAIRIRSLNTCPQDTSQAGSDQTELTVTRTPAGLREMYGGPRLRLSESNEDRPAVLAVMLDDLAVGDWDMSNVAALWQTSNSQIIRFLKLWPAAFDLLNCQRNERGLRPLK